MPMDKSKIPALNLKAVFYDVLKDDLIQWISEFSKVIELEKEWNKMGKWEAIEELTQIYKDPKYHDVMHKRILNDFPSSSGIGPSKVEEILGCTKTERKRWEQEEKLPVVRQINTGSRRSPVWVSMFCRRTIETLTDEVIERWRAEHEEYKALKRRTKEEVEKKETMFVEIRAVRAGDKIEHIFGPVATTPDNIENIWQRQKDNLPFAWQEENLLCSVFMIDFHKQIVLRHQVIGGDQQ